MNIGRFDQQLQVDCRLGAAASIATFQNVQMSPSPQPRGQRSSTFLSVLQKMTNGNPPLHLPTPLQVCGDHALYQPRHSLAASDGVTV